MKRRPIALLPLPAQAAVRRLALAQLRAARKAVRRLERRNGSAGSAADIEALYGFRVAMRRLRTTARAYEGLLSDSVSPRALRRLRRLARQSGGVRDVEAQLEWVEASLASLPSRSRPGAQWLAAKLRERLGTEEGALFAWVVATFNPMHRKLRRRLRRYRVVHRLGREVRPRLFAWAAAEQIAAHAAVLQAQLDGLREGEGIRSAAAHDTRLSGKRLRYLVEAIAQERDDAREIADELKELQDVLGVLGDADLLVQTLAAAELEARSTAVPEAGSEAVPRPRRARATVVTGLRALARKLERERSEALHTLKLRWLDDERSKLARALDDLVADLQRIKPPGEEIERKYLLREVPPRACEEEAHELWQGYLPGVRLVERVRRARSPDGTVRYTRTVKDGEGISRLEIEEEIDAELFQELWPLTAGRRVQKLRHVVWEGEHAWEVDRFTDRAPVLVLCEVELRSREETPSIPAWLAPYVVREVTGDAAYVNRRLAR